MESLSGALVGCLVNVANELHRERNSKIFFIFGYGRTLKYFEDKSNSGVICDENGEYFISFKVSSDTEIMLPVDSIGALSSSMKDFTQFIAVEKINILKNCPVDLEKIFSVTRKVYIGFSYLCSMLLYCSQ